PRRQPQRRRARAASDFEHGVVALQIVTRAFKRALVALHIADRIGCVFACGAIPEARVVGDAEHDLSPVRGGLIYTQDYEIAVYRRSDTRTRMTEIDGNRAAPSGLRDCRERATRAIRDR